MISRRAFLKSGAAAALAPSALAVEPAAKPKMEWIIYQQLGSHMWPVHVKFR